MSASQEAAPKPTTDEELLELLMDAGANPLSLVAVEKAARALLRAQWLTRFSRKGARHG